MSARGWSRLYRALIAWLPERLRERRGEELAGVFDDLIAEARLTGGSAAAHARAARESLDLAGLVIRSRSAAAAAWTAALTGDLRVAARTLWRRRGFASSAAATLAVGIGGATAVFALVDTLLLRPLPYPAADRLVMVWRVVERFEMRRGPISLPNFTDWREGVDAFAAAAAWSPTRPTLVGTGDPVRLRGYQVAGDLFGTLVVGVELGRPLLPSDDLPDAEPVAVLSYTLWTTRFGADPFVVGRTIDLNGVAVRVVGVAREGFDFPARDTEIWTPLAVDPAAADRGLNSLTPLARLAPGVTIAAAEEALRAAQTRVEERYPGGNQVDDVWLEPLRTYEIGDTWGAVTLLAASVGLLLAIGCANLTALLLVRATGRRRELAVRAALGGSSARIVRTLLAEGTVLAAAGGVLGAALAACLLRALALFAPAELLRRGVPSLDPRVLVFCLAAAAVCALACALIPARVEAARGAASALREAGAGPDRRRTVLHDGLVVGQVALATVLLVGAGLLGRSLARLLDQPLGFDADPVLTLQIGLPRSRYASADEAGAFFDDLLARIRVHPAVGDAGATWALPFTNTIAGTRMRSEDAAPDEPPVAVSLVPVRGDYFGAMGVQLREGRLFEAADDAEASPVGIASRSLAEALWPGQPAIGKRVGDGVTIVGVVEDVRRRGLDAEPERDLYRPHAQIPFLANDLYLTVRAASGDPRSLVPVVREAVAALDPALPSDGVIRMSEQVEGSAAEPRSRALLVGVFASAAALLAAIGVYGVLAYRVGQRRPEVALRLALGASRSAVVGGVLAGAGVLGGTGLVLGLGLAAVGAPALRAFLFAVSPLDPAVFGGVAAVIAFAVVAAGWLPARRASRVDPMSSLRGE